MYWVAELVIVSVLRLAFFRYWVRVLMVFTSSASFSGAGICL